MRKLLLGALALGLGACPMPGTTSGPGTGTTASGGATARIDPQQCGDITGSDAGKKLHAFLVASAELEQTSYDLDAQVLSACQLMAGDLQIAATGDAKDVCGRVAQELDAAMASARPTVVVAPPVCRTEVGATTGYVAECEADASARGAVKCHGTCEAVCTGPCDGTCSSGDNATCAGTCTGECKGTCGGACDGYVEVDASQECKASAEVRASIHTVCDKPRVEVGLPPAGSTDVARMNRAIVAIGEGLPMLVVVGKRVELAGKALAHWGEESSQLVDRTAALLGDLGTAAACVGGQIASIVPMASSIQGRFEVSVQASAQVSTAAGVKP